MSMLAKSWSMLLVYSLLVIIITIITIIILFIMIVNVVSISTHSSLISTAIGCEDLRNPPNSQMWIQRIDDVTTVGCSNSKNTWTLKCIGHHWTGAIGNCSEGKYSSAQHKNLLYCFFNNLMTPLVEFPASNPKMEAVLLETRKPLALPKGKHVGEPRDPVM